MHRPRWDRRVIKYSQTKKAWIPTSVGSQYVNEGTPCVNVHTFKMRASGRSWLRYCVFRDSRMSILLVVLSRECVLQTHLDLA